MNKWTGKKCPGNTERILANCRLCHTANYKGRHFTEN